MRKWIGIGCIAICLVGWVMGAQATPYTIVDNYIGGDPTYNWQHVDVIGDPKVFDVSQMDVDLYGSHLVVDVHTRYLDHVGALGTSLGDLFISTDGWKPLGSAPYPDDTALVGEKWEYALVLDNHLKKSGDGSLGLYSISDGDIKLSWAPDGYVYRAGQAVQFTPHQNVTALGMGSYSIIESNDGYDILRFEVNSKWGDVGSFGFHWATTCANDVIEGGYSAPVPEPSTILLLASSLIGLVGIRKKFRRS